MALCCAPVRITGATSDVAVHLSPPAMSALPAPALLAAFVLATAVAVLIVGPPLDRRVRRPGFVRITVVGTALVLVPANLYCAVHGTAAGPLAMFCIAVSSLAVLAGVAFSVLALRI